MSLIRKHGAVLQAWACLDLVVSTYGFRGRPKQRCHLNLPQTDPCGHGNEIWVKIGYLSLYERYL